MTAPRPRPRATGVSSIIFARAIMLLQATSESEFTFNSLVVVSCHDARPLRDVVAVDCDSNGRQFARALRGAQPPRQRRRPSPSHS
eukprot:CAMPEP_0206846072 /NCGR_PEP_ID=MMETSP0975-20121206/24807_1 /ASSEMBLY_ACC=CAM_ASM_000399 /TAXON_ID=483370 /ORGANISM="non described non described, Strain CCMP2097" /LENGTH=85 /DNA_ID=CAMNT_0054388659 /DNA_START=37 /DNA_END=294 /DNA_ORIENTATION=-